MIVIDTSLVIGHLRGKARARALLREHAEDAVVPTLVAWELWKGAASPRDQAAVEAFLDEVPLDPFVGGMARIAGLLQIDQRKAGAERPVFDLLIASHALYHGGKVATLDRDYDGIHGIEVLRPRS